MKKITITNYKRNCNFSLRIDFDGFDYNCFIDHDRKDGVTSHINFNHGCIKEIKSLYWSKPNTFSFSFEKLDREEVYFKINDNSFFVSFWKRGDRVEIEKQLNELFELELEVEI